LLAEGLITVMQDGVYREHMSVERVYSDPTGWVFLRVLVLKAYKDWEAIFSIRGVDTGWGGSYHADILS
jgi:hypothetical protein